LLWVHIYTAVIGGGNPAPVSEQDSAPIHIQSSSEAGAMSHQNIIGQKVRALRVEKELSQEALATQCNLLGWDVSRGTLSKIEARLRRVNDAEVMLLAKVLKCTVADLYPSKDTELLLSVARQGRE
jgi:DNA-binding XRE family transcriptional regulator